MSEHIVVGSDRYITVPESLQKIGVQFDHNAETVTFDCPRYWDGHDLSKMKIYINYMRPNDSFGAHLCSDAEIDSVDDTIMHFNWTISGHVTEFAGPLSFLICICDVDQNGDSTTHWNSELNTQLYISSGMKCRDAILGRYPDIITQLLNRMDSVEAVFAPTVEITEIEGGHHLKMIDVNGTYEFDVMDGNKGDKGDAFTYSDFTAEQLAALKGEKGDAFTYSDFTAEQLAALKGEKGDTGSGLRILGYYETLTALESSVTNPSVGDAYGIGSSEPYNIYIYTDINGWVDNGALQGAKGEDGRTPEKGIDYFTDADKQEIATAASEMIGQATDTKQGLVMVNGENGIGVNTEDGSLYIKSATEAEIDGKSHSYNSIVPSNLNYAVKAGLINNSIALTEAEKASALSWIGSIPASDKGKAGGVATLDGSGKVPSGQIPTLEYAGKTHASQHASGGSDPITPADIGAAPAGYGLGEVIPTLISNCNTTKNGWYRVDASTVDIPDVGLTNGVLRIDEADGDLIHQSLYFYVPGKVHKMERVHFNGTWYPWEWVNPPMDVDIEYRTTERHLGNPVYKKMDSDGVIWWSTDQSTWKREADRVGAASSTHANQHATNGSDPITPASIGAIPSSDKGKAGGVATLDSSGKVPSGQIPSLEYAGKTHASQHATNGSDPITPEDIGAMPSMKRTFIYDGINSTKKLTTAGWYRILKHNSPDDKAFLINIGHEYSDTGPENMLFFVCSKLSCPSIVVLSHSNNPSRPTIIFYKKIRITKDSNYTYIDFYRAQDGDECIPRVSIIEFITDATVVQDKKSEPLDVLPVDEAPDGETILLMQDVSVIPSGNVLTDANKAKSVAVTLTASGWDSSAKTQTVTVSGVLADETKQLITPTPALASQAAYYDAVILCTGQAANKLTFTAKKVPTANLTVYVTIQEVGA